jgi:arylsulfatase A-like enzyme
MVSALDEAFINVTQALEDTGIADNMLMIFTTDVSLPYNTSLLCITF